APERGTARAPRRVTELARVVRWAAVRDLLRALRPEARHDRDDRAGERLEVRALAAVRDDPGLDGLGRIRPRRHDAPLEADVVRARAARGHEERGDREAEAHAGATLESACPSASSRGDARSATLLPLTGGASPRMVTFLIVAGALVGVIALVAIYDVFIQRSHTLLHNFPVVARFRYMMEELGPPLRQYIVAKDTDERPYDRTTRSWVYQ